MRKLLLILILSIPLFLMAQNWAPAGATWYYGFSVWINEGYYKVEYVGDTTINTIQCKKLKKTLYTQDLSSMLKDTVVIGTEYTYADNNSVYIYKHNKFYTLYNFSAQVGNTWTVPEIKHYNGCDTIGIVKVDSIGTMIINGITLRYICVSLANTSQKWGWNAKIVERIGPIKSFGYHQYPYDYLFPVKYDDCGMVIDELIEGGNFRCYSDNTPFFYTSNIAPSCDFLTSINPDKGNYGQIKLLPNPTNGILQLISDGYTGDLKISVQNVQGMMLQAEVITIKEKLYNSKIDLSGYPDGIYFIQLITDESSGIYKIVKQ